MNIHQIDGLLLREMVITGASYLEKNRDAIDALNVFPVPDGDTGTNMNLTLSSAVKEVNAKEYLKACDAAHALAKGALRGARGNSGVILSQLYRGFSKAVEGLDQISPMLFAQALRSGAEMAYKAVMRPKEGTILTVARVIAEEAVKQAEAEPDNFEGLMNTILSSGRDILERTPDMLPVLKQAGVVDAGGRGLLLIYEGYYAAMGGSPAEVSTAAADSASVKPEEAAISAEAESKYAYRLSFDIFPLDPKVTEPDVLTFRRHIARISNDSRIRRTEAGFQVELLTNDPGKALQYGMFLGELNNVCLINLKAKQRDAASAASPEEEQPQELVEYGLVSVAQGDGFKALFTDLGVQCIIEGGQTMNPAIEDLVNAIRSVHAKNVFVLPNNGNVILAAQQAAEICEENVFVVPTKNVAMGIAAVVAFQPDLPSDVNLTNMNAASEQVRTGMITYAVRDSEFENLHIHQGDIIGLHNGRVEVCDQDIHSVALTLMQSLVTEDDSLITIYYGADIAQDQAEALQAELAQLYPECDVEVHSGGQPLYYYILSVE